MAKAIGTLGTVDTITVGGRVFTDLTNLIIIMTSITTASRYGTFRKASASAGYTPSGGLTFKFGAIRMIPAGYAAGDSDSCQLLYGDNDVGVNSAAAPTTPVFPGGGTVFEMGPQAVLTLQASAYGGEGITDFVVPNGKYPGAFHNGAGSLIVYQGFGYQV